MKYTVTVDAVFTSSIATSIEVGDKVIVLNGCVIAVEKPTITCEYTTVTDVVSEEEVYKLLYNINPNSITARGIAKNLGDTPIIRASLRVVLKNLVKSGTIIKDHSLSKRYPSYGLNVTKDLYDRLSTE